MAWRDFALLAIARLGAALRLKKTGTGAPVPEYTHFDSQGSAVAATNAAGTITWRERYAPFGEELLNPAANADNTGYTGHLKDDATGLNYMQARYYDPIIGRFLSTDPIGYQDQLNLYAYVANDPVNKIDPNGEAAQLVFKFAVDFVIESAIQYATTGTVNIGTAATDAATGLVNPLKTVERAKELLKVVDKAGDKFSGGAYKDLVGKGGSGIECHHCPANSASPLSKGDGPAIQMDKADHKQTASYGNSKEAQQYRAKQHEMISNGDLKGAQQMDIDDVQSKFGDKYDDAIDQMKNYTDELDGRL